MSPWIVAALVVLVVLCAARRAQADRAIVVDEQGFALRGSASASPFAAQELAAAIRVRIAPEGMPVRIRVTPTSTGVRIETRGETREVELGELRGADAARMVALVANDLLIDDLATPAPPLELQAPHAAPELGVLGGVSGWDGMLGGLTIDLAVPRDGWVMTLEAGGGELVNSTLHLLAGVVRIGPALRLGVPVDKSGKMIDGFEIRAGATFAPLLVTSGVGDQTVLAGANASVRMRLALTAGVHAVLAAGVDAYATHTQYQLAAMTVPTPWVAPWLCAGIEVGL